MKNDERKTNKILKKYNEEENVCIEEHNWPLYLAALSVSQPIPEGISRTPTREYNCTHTSQSTVWGFHTFSLS